MLHEILGFCLVVGFFGVLLFFPLILLLSLLALSPHFVIVFPATAENGVGSLLLIVLVSVCWLHN